METVCLDTYKHTAGVDHWTNPRVAPTGRVIKSARRGIIPDTRAANLDSPVTSIHNIIRSNKRPITTETPKKEPASVPLRQVLISGFLVGAVSSAVIIYPSGRHNATDSLDMLGFVSARLSDHETLEPDSPRPPVAALRLPTLNLTTTDQREAAKTLAPTRITTKEFVPPKEERTTIRLASFSAPIRTEHLQVTTRKLTLPQSSLAPDSKPTTGLTELNPETGLTERVQRIIGKYAPKHQSPRILAEAIVDESRKQSYDPLFVAAVIKSESRFNAAARSHKGAQGLMQIMPATGAWLSAKNALPKGKLSDPGHNLRLGISYLRHLDQEYRGNKMFTLVAYNWGPGHVESATDGRRRIPKECLTYAIRILSDYKRWRSGLM